MKKRKQINIKFTDSKLDSLVYDYLKSRTSLIEWLRLTVLKEVQKNGKKD